MPVALLSIVALELVQWLHRRFSLTALLSPRPVMLRWSVYTAVVLAVVLLGVYRNNQFIYFQF
jgi:hypothetical protein